MDRRDFLKGLGTISALSFVPRQAYSFHSKKSRAVITTVIQGLTTETTTQLAITVDKTKIIHYTLTDLATGKIFEPVFVKSNSNPQFPQRIDKIGFENLQLAHEYQLRVIEGQTNQTIDDRLLSTIDLNKINPRIGVFSCMKADSSMVTRMWPSAEAANLDYLFLIGDNVYGDNVLTHGPDILWQHYMEGREAIPFYHWKKLKPTIAIWDDHDYGRNDSNGTYQYKDQNLQTFRSMYAMEPLDSVLIEGPGNSRCFKAFGQNFIFCDNRYFRDLPDNGGTGFLGTAQMNWVNKMAVGGNSTWVLEGSPFFGRAQKGRNSYSVVSPEELDAFTRMVSKWDNPALFVAGDLHYSEISQIDRSVLGYQTYEVISSSMHSTLKSKLYDNPNPSLNSYLKENFILFEKMGRISAPSWKISCIGENSTVRFSNNLNIA